MNVVVEAWHEVGDVLRGNCCTTANICSTLSLRPPSSQTQPIPTKFFLVWVLVMKFEGCVVLAIATVDAFPTKKFDSSNFPLNPPVDLSFAQAGFTE